LESNGCTVVAWPRALAPNTDFWTRPEIRLYLTRVGGNDAVKAAGTFGTKSSAILAGIQVEAWWE